MLQQVSQAINFRHYDADVAPLDLAHATRDPHVREAVGDGSEGLVEEDGRL